ncbi:MAG: hypothetical protein ABL995_21140, partial [Bryobacteraceae bacterium]
LRLSPLQSHSPLLTYLLTFSCYGLWLPGDARGSVERKRGTHRGGAIPPSIQLRDYAKSALHNPAKPLTPTEAAVVLNVLQEVCLHRAWRLRAAHIRTTHVHVVLDAPADPHKAIALFKAWVTRRLNENGGASIRWSRGGNAARLSTDAAIQKAIRYVSTAQGTPMAVYVAE